MVNVAKHSRGLHPLSTFFLSGCIDLLKRTCHFVTLPRVAISHMTTPNDQLWKKKSNIMVISSFWYLAFNKRIHQFCFQTIFYQNEKKKQQQQLNARITEHMSALTSMSRSCTLTSGPSCSKVGLNAIHRINHFPTDKC